MKQRGNIILTILICLIIIPVHLNAGEDIGVTTDTVKIGGLVDFTGPLSSTYQTLIEGLRIYIRHVNDQGGIHGRKIKHVAEDDRYSIPGAMSGFKKLIFRDKVLALAPGASGLGHTHAIIPLAEKNRIPLLAATNEYKYYNPVRRYIFAPLPFYEDQVKIIFKYIMEDMGDKDPQIAVAYPDVASGKVTLEASRKQAELHGIKLVEETVIPIMVGDCFSQVIGLKRLKPEYVIVHGYVANTVSFLKDAQRGGLHCKFFVVQYGCSEETVRIAKKATKNMMGVNCFGSWHNDSPGMVKLREITLKYAPNSGSRTRNYMQGWFVALMTCLGLERTGRDLTRESFVDGLEKIRDYDTGGICGVISYGPADHKSIEEHRMYKVDVEKEVLVPLTGWRRAEE